MNPIVETFLTLAATVGILLIVVVIVVFALFVWDMTAGVYEEYKKIKQQEQGQEQDEHL